MRVGGYNFIKEEFETATIKISLELKELGVFLQ